MTNLEMLRTATPEQIADMFCDMICGKCGKCSDACPSFLFDRCGEGKNGVLEWLNDEGIAPKDAPNDAPSDVPKGWMKLKEELCNEIGGCDKCPPPISKHCEQAVKAMEAWKKPQEPDDTPRGWIKLSDDTYINVSKIVGLTVRRGGPGAVTAIYTIGAEDSPWIVNDSVEEVMEKIAKA